MRPDGVAGVKAMTASSRERANAAEKRLEVVLEPAKAKYKS
jgi:hypothetical protein